MWVCPKQSTYCKFSDMVSHSGKLVSAAEDAIAAVNLNNREDFNDALWRLYQTYRLV